MPPVPTWFKGLAWAMAALLGVSAALQLNDPDPVRWIALYGGGALVSVVLPARKPVAALALLLGLIAAAWAIYLIHSVWGVIALADLPSRMSEKGGAVEVGREAGGLAIAAVWLVLGAAFRGTRA